MVYLKLSISFCYHDSCITFSNDQEILLHLEAERLFRVKHLQINNVSDLEILIESGLKHLGATIDNVVEVFITKLQYIFDSEKVTILGKQFPVNLTSHHENHIGTSYPSGFEKCVIVCADGGSEDGTTKIYYKNREEIFLVDDLENSPYTGRFYGTITQMVIHPDCRLAHNTHAGKLMGLSSMGEFSNTYSNLLGTHWREINKLHFSGCRHLLKLFDISEDYSHPWADRSRVDLAYTAQQFWVNNFCEQLKKYSLLSENVCLVGGCALNISLNSKLLTDGVYKKVYVSPISSDSGQSLGAILYRYPHLRCNYPFLGRGFGEIADFNSAALVEDLLNKCIIGWFQGRSEVGPRSLGHRSFIGIPSTIDMKEKLSVIVKKREEYRPVAAIVPEDLVSEYFDQTYISPYMTFSAKAKDTTKQLAPAIVHYDDTTRVQTLSNRQNPELYEVLMRLKREIGVPILMNSSFNLASEPIVDSPEDALRSFQLSKADYLYINGRKYSK